MSDIVRFSEPGVVTIRINFRPIALTLLGLCIALPPLYLLGMLKYGAIRLPYWDHINTAKQIVDYFDGTLTWASLIETQAQARPLFPRLIFIASAAVSNWDIRLEYVYNTAMIFGALAVLLFALWKISKGWSLTARLFPALLISILACSPAGNMNHYWSLMLIATLPYFLTFAVFVAISFKPQSWPLNIACAVLAWVATYSISQGLFIFPVMVFVHQMIAKNKFTPTGLAMFWLVNMVACSALYLPGVPSSAEHPTLLNFLIFIAEYIGNPLGALLWFPHAGANDLLPNMVINFACGLAILSLTTCTAWKALREAKTPAVLMFLSLSCYAAICTVVTAWGRAVGPLAIESANVSRYSVFAACFLFALIFYYSPRFAERDAVSGWKRSALAIFLTLAAVSYYRGVSAYALANSVNGWVVLAYAPEAAPTAYDAQMFNDAAIFKKIRSDLFRLKIGPYRTNQ